MCFRPSAMTSDKNTQTATCPTCGMPVVASSDTTSGTCPYCKNPIPANPNANPSENEAGGNVRIL